ncbi:MAG: glycosyltransferase family A protein [Planctomycetota bacterium]
MTPSRTDSAPDGPTPDAPASLAVVIPARNAADTIDRCLDAVLDAQPTPDQVVLVDDGSTDDTTARAQHRGVAIVQGGTPDAPLGPALARNRAVDQLRTDLVAFVDADCVVAPDALTRLADAMADHPRLGAAFGSYDAHPPGRHLAGQYKNLLHHVTHQAAPTEVHTFWSGLGIVRREAFQQIGGFCPRFTQPAIEDIDLGARLRASDWSIRVVPDAQCAHLKDWTAPQVWKTDIFQRAIPWTRLIHRTPNLPPQLNIGRVQQAAALAAVAIIPLLALGLVAPVAWIAAAFAIGFAITANARLANALLRHGGPRLLAVGLAMHLAYYHYSLATFAIVTAHEKLAGTPPQPAPPAATPPSAA